MGAPCPPETPSWVALDFGGPLKKKKGLREGHEGGVGRRVTGGHLLGGGLRGRGRGARGSDPPLKDTARSGAGVSSGQATRSEHKPEGSPLPAVQQPQALPPSPVPGGGGIPTPHSAAAAAASARAPATAAKCLGAASPPLQAPPACGRQPERPLSGGGGPQDCWAQGRGVGVGLKYLLPHVFSTSATRLNSAGSCS